MKLMKRKRKVEPVEYALMLISYRDRTEKELRDRMKRKGYQLEEIKRTITYMIEAGYLKEEEYIKRVIIDTLRYKKKGWLALKSVLFEKGFKKELIESLKEEDFLNFEKEAIKELVIKKQKVYSKKDKLLRYLYNRGYSIEIIKGVLEAM